MKLILLLSFMVLVFALSPEPVPTCSVPAVSFKDFPISVNQIQSFNPNEIFKGYNLNYTLLNAPSFITMRDKFKLYKSQNISQHGLINFHMDHEDNHWGKKLVTISEAANSTIIRWGISDTIDAIPTINEQATVESDPNVQCYDAVWLRAAGIIMVDCMRKTGNYSGQNVFFYLNATSQQVIPKQINNDMYVAYGYVSRRKIAHYIQDGEQYLVRAYFADSVPKEQNHNTYLEIMLINNPFRPWTIKVMDRSYLSQDKLSIMDFKIYLGDMYILDYHTGVTSFDITPSQNIVIKGRYRTDSGYQRMGIYTNNLDNEVLLALANQHGIYEVDWSNQIRPVIIAKYSIMQNSNITSVWVNEEYIAVQFFGNVTDEKVVAEEYHSTFIFDRGTRTYTNAYAVFKHSSRKAMIDMNMDHSFLLSIDEDGVDTYIIDEPIISIYPTNTADEGKEFKFTIKAISANENSGASLICSFDMVFVVVQADSMAIWPTGIQFPRSYYANYPGQLIIPLNRYVVGANLTYGVQQKVYNESIELPPHWILQQNDTLLHWDREPSFFKYTFLRKQQFQWMGEEFFFIYTQDILNKTHIAECRTPAMFSKDVYCRADSHQPAINYKIDNLTATAFMPNYGLILHLVAVTYEELPNEVLIYNVGQKTMFSKPIILGKDWQGKIQSIEFLGHYLAVTLRHMKTIVFYDMKICHDHQDKICEEMYRVDSIMMDGLGVKYFSPLDIYTSDFHPFVLFIQNVDCVIMLDITRKGPILLDVIDSPATKQPGFWKWKMAITKGHLVIINPPNTIEEYSLNELYTRKTTHMTKAYPLYNYTIPDKFDCDFSDKGDLLYIAAIDKNLPADKNTVILVYRSGTPAVSAFYDVFHIEGKYDDLLLDVTGNFADYVSVTMGSILMMFRQYQVPVLVIQDSWSDFEFNLTYTNDAEGRYHYLSNSKVLIANYPEVIVINQTKLNQTDFLTKQIKYEKKNLELSLDDTNWFNGSVTNYTLEGCDECGKKVRVVGHLEEKRDFYAETDMEDYAYTTQGGVIQQFQSVIKMRHNGSVSQIVQFPSVLDGQHCTHIKHSWIYDYTLSACEHLGEIYLYTTTYTSFKPFVNGPFYSGAKYVAGLHIMEDILILIDVDENPWQMKREGGIIIYAMNHDPFDPEMFDQIEIIQTDDLQHAVNWPGGPAFIGSADVVYLRDAEVYRLIITQVRHGIFFVDFKWTRGRRSIEIIKVEFRDLNALLIKKDMHMPNQAFFQAVAVTTFYDDKIFKFTELQIVVTTRNFHTLKFDFHIDKTGTVLDSFLSKVFYRYGYYSVGNYIKAFDGYFVVVHNLPTILEPFDQMARKVLTVYDTRERWVFNSTEKAPVSFMAETKVPASYMLAGMRFRKGRVACDFNVTLTRNRSDPFRDIGLLVVHDRDAIIREVAIHDHIMIIAEEGLQNTQQAKLKANSDFSSVSIPLKFIVNREDDPDGGVSGGAIVAIVIGCILVAVGGGYLVYRWNLKRQQKIGEELEESLIDRETFNVPKQDDESDSDEQQDEEDEQDEQDEEEEEQTTPQATIQTNTAEVPQEQNPVLETPATQKIQEKPAEKQGEDNKQ